MGLIEHILKRSTQCLISSAIALLSHQSSAGEYPREPLENRATHSNIVNSSESVVDPIVDLTHAPDVIDPIVDLTQVPDALKKSQTLKFEIEMPIIETTRIIQTESKNEDITNLDSKAISTEISEGWEPKTVILVLGVLVTFFLGIFNFFYIRSNRKKDARKSAYDDLWYREVYFKPLNDALLEFRKEWNESRVQRLFFSGAEEVNVLVAIEEYIGSIAALRDLALVLKVISPTGSEKIQSHFDQFESVILSPAEGEGFASQAINNIHRFNQDFHAKMIDVDFDMDKLRKHDFGNEVAIPPKFSIYQMLRGL